MYTLIEKLLLASIALTGSMSVSAATITVTGNGDTSAVDGVVTLREAINSINTGANVNADVAAVGSYGSSDTIAFTIAGAGVHTIAVAALPGITKPVKIDGYTQPGAQPNSNGPTQGTNALLKIELTMSSGSLALAAGNSTVQGLVINGVAGTIYLLNGGGNTIAGNFLGTNAVGTTATPHAGINVDDIIAASSSPNNTIGGSAPAARNLVSGTSDLAFQNVGILLVSTGNVVQGNLIGTNAAGSAAIPNDIGIEIFADNNVIGGTTTAVRNVISGNRLQGLEVDSLNNQIEGNYVGTDASGAQALANGNFGIAVGGANNTIGGTAAGAGNLISGNGTVGVAVTSGSTGNKVQGNRIGTDASGTQAICGHSMAGVEVGGGGNVIGGAQAGAANIIAFNKNDGVRVDGGTGSSIMRNSIFSNSGGGIRLGSSGVPTPNDPGDTDTGPNNLQNYPVLNASAVGGIGFDIGATLNSMVGVFHLEFFSGTSCGRFAHGEGRTLTGSADVATDNNGNANFAPQLFLTSPGQTALTATATDAAGNTSEFSLCLDDRIFANAFEPLPVVCQ